MISKYTVPIEPDKFYHIYNRGNNGEMLFYQPKNYTFFLKKYDNYFDDFLITHSFCLLPNHFHILAEIKSESEILHSIFTKAKHKKLRKFFHFENLPDFSLQNMGNQVAVKELIKPNPADFSLALSKQFASFFISYSKSINKQESRTGSLFEKPFKRILIQSDKYYKSCICYIHRNPLHHKIFEDFFNYPWSSYKKITESRKSKLPKEYILEKFGDKENYHFVHQKEQDTDYLSEIVIE
jgi:putative transposase